jgi:hypothetical protein
VRWGKKDFHTQGGLLYGAGVHDRQESTRGRKKGSGLEWGLKSQSRKGKGHHRGEGMSKMDNYIHQGE